MHSFKKLWLFQLLVEAEGVVSLRIVGGTPVEKGEYPFQVISRYSTSL